AELTPSAPVRSVAEVRFPDDGRTFPYYNDRFDLKEGDVVFVSGKLAGKLGVVDRVTTKFKVDLSYYQKVIARPEFCLHGTFVPMGGLMVCTGGDSVPDAETFRSWVKPPLSDAEKPSEIVCGEGYALDLDAFEQDPETRLDAFDRALDCCREGRVRYVSLKGGVGTAFVEGSSWYEIDFRYDGRQIADLYCECPYPGLCKHALAVLSVLRVFSERLNVSDLPDLIAVEQRFFQRALCITGQSVTV
ncbi:MAG: SWIM zinc finger family protein, partial [Oscillibacter sp.]|nr:SWIM zinc finger family protein [Oscillibacter sp.]